MSEREVNISDLNVVSIDLPYDIIKIQLNVKFDVRQTDTKPKFNNNVDLVDTKLPKFFKKYLEFSDNEWINVFLNYCLWYSNR